MGDKEGMTIVLFALLRGKITLEEVMKRDDFGGYIPFSHHFNASQLLLESLMFGCLFTIPILVMKLLEITS